MKIQVYELVVKVYIVENIYKDNIYEKISEIIDLALSKDISYLEFHKKNCYKNYCNNGLYPIESDGVYKEDNIYSFQIRTIDEKLARYLLDTLPNIMSNFMKVLKVDIKLISKKHIDKIYSITPVIIKDNTGYWKGNISISEFEKRLKTNLIKKYNEFTGEKINEDFEFYTSLEFKNKKPVAVNYKNIKLLGDKIQLNIADDTTSQLISYVALGVGIGENNGRSMGYVNFRWL